MNDPQASKTTEETNWGMFAHLSALLGFVIPFGNVVGPLVIWLTKGKESAHVAEQAKESLNFQITVALAFLVCFVLAFVVIGFFLMGVVALADLILVFIAAFAASKGEAYRYPFAVRLVK